MPVHCWKEKDGKWACRWGNHGHIYKAKDKSAASKKAGEQGRAAHANGYKGK